MHVVRPPCPEDVADLFALDQRRCRPSHVARLEPVPLGLGQVHLDFELGHALLELDIRVLDPVDPGERLPDFQGFLVEDVEIGSEDTHDDGLARTRQHLFDPFVEVRLHVVEHPRVAGHHVLDRAVRLRVVGRGVDGNPVLTEVHPGDLVSEECLPDVRSEVADAGYRP